MRRYAAERKNKGMLTTCDFLAQDATNPDQPKMNGGFAPPGDGGLVAMVQALVKLIVRDRCNQLDFLIAHDKVNSHRFDTVLALLQGECEKHSVAIRHVYNCLTSTAIPIFMDQDAWFVECWPADEMEFNRSKGTQSPMEVPLSK